MLMDKRYDKLPPELTIRPLADEWSNVDIFNLIQRHKEFQEDILSFEISIRSYDIEKAINELEEEIKSKFSDLFKIVRYDNSGEYVDFMFYDKEYPIYPVSIVNCTLNWFSNIIYVRCYTSKYVHNSLVTLIKKAKNNNNTLVEWHYSTKNGSNHSMVPLNNNFEIKDEYYPYIKEGVTNYYDRYNNSTAPVLILIGDPGTGKTSFIRNYISYSGKQAVVTYDENIMSSDKFLIEFLTSKDTDLLIIEDADVLLSSRNKENNRHMAKFLNISDGIVRMNHKKIIFSTNLKDQNQIDSALTRPGRAFDILNFRPLTYKEAHVINQNIPNQSEFTLADVFNGKNSSENQIKVGFV